MALRRRETEPNPPAGEADPLAIVYPSHLEKSLWWPGCLRTSATATLKQNALGHLKVWMTTRTTTHCLKL